MKSISRLTTTQKLLIELRQKGVPLSLILERGQLNAKQIKEAINGKTSETIYLPLLSIWCLLNVNEKKCEKLETMIYELEMKNAFFGGTEYDNKSDLTNYADRRGV